MENILHDIAALITITFVLGGVVLILLVIHFLSVYFKQDRREGNPADSLQALRHEARNCGGVSPHSLFYHFFFRREMPPGDTWRGRGN